eukprot:gnl/MRDRNA2_/MRDRNA2_71770_c0_seq2.p1 gnl/MRDRNA2_/MRDRNA2_71770_c0~~gnl/MRDRNA2_/MRDRNA2_71770_c0_seq2.p1  ORF type:complete len:340 (+),score=49.04 gnl/MRDRNA2_/MRDRNA2_71770_c0_seq2:151-1170(+)
MHVQFVLKQRHIVLALSATYIAGYVTHCMLSGPDIETPLLLIANRLQSLEKEVHSFKTDTLPLLIKQEVPTRDPTIALMSNYPRTPLHSSDVRHSSFNGESVSLAPSMPPQPSGLPAINFKPRGQYSQDLWVANLFPSGGFYVDIGAHHANFMSNTRELDVRGWKGLCIEALVLKNRDWNIRTCKILEVALVPRPTVSGNVSFTNCEDGSGTSGYSGVSTIINRNTQQRHRCSQVLVKAVTFESLLPLMPAVVQYMSLDVEGAEFQILSTMPWNSVCIEAITIENHLGQFFDKVRFEMLQRNPHKCKLIMRHQNVEDFYRCNCDGFNSGTQKQAAADLR